LQAADVASNGVGLVPSAPEHHVRVLVRELRAEGIELLPDVRDRRLQIDLSTRSSPRSMSSAFSIDSHSSGIVRRLIDGDRRVRAIECLRVVRHVVLLDGVPL
jgi:hypothetical protein